VFEANLHVFSWLKVDGLHIFSQDGLMLRGFKAFLRVFKVLDLLSKSAFRNLVGGLS
jgi:hypothetical protein